MAIFSRKLSSVLNDLGMGIACAPKVMARYDRDFE
jgi:hypothetical protein